MLLFFGLSFFLLLGALIPVRNQNFYLLLSFFILFILSAFRDISVGTDTKNYEELFNSFEMGVEWIREEIEPGWVFLNDLVIFFGGGYQDLLIISTLLTLIPVFIIAKKDSINPMFTISLYYLLYFYFYSFNISRQLIAVSFILFALTQLLNRKNISFLILIGFASFFHVSALICLPLLFLNKLPNDNFKLISISIASMFVGLFGIDYISKIVGLTGYNIYVEYYDSGNILGNAIFLILFNALFIFILLTSKKITSELKLYFVFILFLNLTIRLPMGNRLLLYFSVYQVLFYPYYLSVLNKFSSKSKSILILIILLFSYTIFYMSFGSGEILPYRNVLF